ncbi:MAG TPA: rhodanese-like domain-containing protein [Rhizomicrobium sp.]|nr:rhodanese-like domain-containing protein [Rhizomicrobium sp.]
MTSVNARPDYAGDVECNDAWAQLQANPKAQLVDVRTSAEWNFVGVPDLSGIGRATLCVEWQRFPDMAIDPGFVGRTGEQLRQAGANENTPVFFLCRSGARSRAAAKAMAAAGFAHAYNIAGGFEGDLDQDRHRGNRNGWKAEGLPWKQG